MKHEPCRRGRRSLLQRDLINRCNLAQSSAKYFAAFAQVNLQILPHIVAGMITFVLFNSIFATFILALHLAFDIPS